MAISTIIVIISTNNHKLIGILQDTSLFIHIEKAIKTITAM